MFLQLSAIKNRVVDGTYHNNAPMAIVMSKDRKFLPRAAPGGKTERKVQGAGGRQEKEAGAAPRRGPGPASALEKSWNFRKGI